MPKLSDGKIGGIVTSVVVVLFIICILMAAIYKFYENNENWYRQNITGFEKHIAQKKHPIKYKAMLILDKIFNDESKGKDYFEISKVNPNRTKPTIYNWGY
jgi:hypothetical protein